MEICSLNQRSDDTQPSVVVLSVFGHEVERRHTITGVVFFLLLPSTEKEEEKTKYKADTNARAHTHTHVVFIPHSTDTH